MQERSPESLAVAKGRKFGRASLTPKELELYLDYFREATRRSAAKYPDRIKARQKAWYDANYPRIREQVIARAVAWRKDRRRDFAMKVNQLAVRYGVPGKLDWRDLIYGDCAYCGTPCQSWDHVMPMSRGGANTLDNLVPCCWPCNTWKRARTPEEWWEAIAS